MAATSRATYTLEVAWDAYATGIFTVGASVLAGVDVLGVSPFDETFTGSYDNVTSRLRSGRSERGRDSLLENILAGRASFDLRDPDGTFNPANPASPVAATLDSRRHPVRWRAKLNGVTYGLFYGFTEEILWEPEGRRGVTRLICLDLLAWLSELKPVIAAAGATTTGAAIGMILDAAGWIDPSARNLDTGDAIPDFSADGTRTALQLIEALLEAELGVFYIAGDGTATYESRHSRAVRTSVATITDEMIGLQGAVDFKLVRNRVSVTRTQNAYTAVAEDTDSQRRLGLRDVTAIETPYLGSDSAADGLASTLLARVVRPRPPMRNHTIDHRTDALLTQALSRELVDVVTLAEAQGGSVGSYHIESVRHQVGARRGVQHETTWLLSEASELRPFQVGVSAVAATGATSGDVLVY